MVVFCVCGYFFFRFLSASGRLFSLFFGCPAGTEVCFFLVLGQSEEKVVVALKRRVVVVDVVVFVSFYRGGLFWPHWPFSHSSMIYFYVVVVVVVFF